MKMTGYGVVELRQYTLHPGRRDELIELFEREFIEPQEILGMDLLGLFRDAARPDRFVWLRAFPNMVARKEALEGFYGGPVWGAHRDAANATMIDSDNVLLLRPGRSDDGVDFPGSVRAPILCSIVACADSEELSAFANRFEFEIRSQLVAKGASVLRTLETEPSENTFPRLPVREGEWHWVVMTSGIAESDVRLLMPQAEILELVPTRRSKIQVFH